MEPKMLTHEIARYYILDQQAVVNPELFAVVNGFNRSRNLEGLATCSSLFCQALHTMEDWRFLRQVEAFFKKNALFADETKCFEAAKATFEENEVLCQLTNIRLRKAYLDPDLYLSKDIDLCLQINLMRRFIRNVLGDFHEFINALPALVKVTPGATAQSSRRNSLPQQKLGLKPYVTFGARKYVALLFRWFGFERFAIKHCESNRIECVPKNWKTNRSIACEPEGNIPLQLAVDTWVKRKLKLQGIDLSDQSRNQRLAKHASIYNDFVTVDFSSASDTISIETVRWLLPPLWFKYLDNVRSPFFRGVFGTGKYAKFSSMGNGATFVLESLIFGAMCHALGSRKFLVYGDDVIIEERFFSRFCGLAKFLGFSVNQEKTFSCGPFRESCGGDYFLGNDVTPVYIRNIDSRKASLCHLVNSLGAITHQWSELAKYLSEIVKDYSLPYVPYNENTMSGIWIDPVVARRLKLLVRRAVRKGGPVLDHYRAYCPLAERRVFVDSRGYYLWFLRKNSQVLFAGPWGSSNVSQSLTITSSVPVFRHRYVRKWVVWFPPNDGTSDLINWSELISRNNSR